MTCEIEVEVKLPVKELSSVEKKLVHLGAKYLGMSIQCDSYYNHPCRNFASTDEALRIRESHKELDLGDSEYVELTYKGPKLTDDTKTREETSILIKDSKNVPRFLQQLGFEFVMTVKKQRRSYQIDEVTITLDDIEGLGVYVEFETIVVSKDEITKGESTISDLITRLGLDPYTSIRLSYLELLLEKNQN